MIYSLNLVWNNNCKDVNLEILNEGKKGKKIKIKIKKKGRLLFVNNNTIKLRHAPEIYLESAPYV